jgi:hypothetical protein
MQSLIDDKLRSYWLALRARGFDFDKSALNINSMMGTLSINFHLC